MGKTKCLNTGKLILTLKKKQFCFSTLIQAACVNRMPNEQLIGEKRNKMAEKQLIKHIRSKASQLQLSVNQLVHCFNCS